MQLRSSMYKGYARSVPPEIQRGNRSRVLPSDHKNILRKIWMGFVIVVPHFCETLAGNIQIIRQVVVAR